LYFWKTHQSFDDLNENSKKLPPQRQPYSIEYIGKSNCFLSHTSKLKFQESSD